MPQNGGGRGWSWDEDSNEKVMPSQSVNSPSWLPVSKRRPPGVHDKAMMGVEFLARVTWAMYVT